MPTNKRRTPKVPKQIPHYTRNDIEVINQTISSHLATIAEAGKKFEKADLSKKNIFKGYRLPENLLKELLAVLEDEQSKKNIQDSDSEDSQNSEDSHDSENNENIEEIEDFKKFFANVIFFTANKKIANDINLMIYGRLRRLGEEFHGNTDYFARYRQFNCSSSKNTPLLIHTNLKCICLLPNDINSELDLQDCSESLIEELKLNLMTMFKSLPRVWRGWSMQPCVSSESEESSSEGNRNPTQKRHEISEDDENIPQNVLTNPPESMEQEPAIQIPTTNTSSTFQDLNNQFKKLKTTIEESTQKNGNLKQNYLNYQTILERINTEFQKKLDSIKQNSQGLNYGFETPQKLMHDIEQQTQHISDLNSSQIEQKAEVSKLMDEVKPLQIQINEVNIKSASQTKGLENIEKTFAEANRVLTKNNEILKYQLEICLRHLNENSYDLFKISFAIEVFNQEIDNQLTLVQQAMIPTTREANTSQSQPFSPTQTL